MFRNLTADEQPVDRCFLWLQEAGVPAPSTQGGKHRRMATGQPGSAGERVASLEESGATAAEALEASLQQEGRTRPRATAAHAALVLQRLVRSAARRAQREAVHSGHAFPLLQISGSLQCNTCFGQDTSSLKAPAFIMLIMTYTCSCM